jgi:GT2 family glycosyltransferase
MYHGRQGGLRVIPIIIPFYKAHDKLKRCQAAIGAQTHRECETFVRDNTHDNILYTAAVNEGLRKYCWRDDVRYVVVLNQDAYMQKECVQRLADFMDAHPDCGIACPIQYAETGSAMRWSGPGTPLTVSSSRVVTWGGSLRAFPSGVHQVQDYAVYRNRAPFETHWANGACMMLRVDAVRECGLLDRNMRFICSDSDFSFTARARGWKVHVVPQAQCEHQLGASGGESNPEIERVKLRDALYFAQKWLTGEVYRGLASEGPELSPIAVRQHVARMKHQLRAMESAPPTAAAPAYPGWLTEMRMPAQQRRPGSFRT